MSLPIFRGDDLKSITAQMYETKYQLPEIELFRLPVASESLAGAESIEFDIFASRGVAQFGTASETSVPLIQEQSVRTNLPQQYQLLGYDISIAEMRAAAVANRLPAINERRMKAVRQGIADTQNVLGLFGSSAQARLGTIAPAKIGHEGLYNHSKALSVATSAVGVWTAATTADRIYKDLIGLLNAIRQQTTSVENPNMLVLPAAQWDLASTIFFAGTATPFSALDQLRISRPDVMMIRSDTLGTAGTGGVPRAVAFDSSKIERILAVPFEVYEPQNTAYTMVFPCLGMSGGVLTPYPKSLAYMDGI